jgi:hypothetical protein
VIFAAGREEDFHPEQQAMTSMRADVFSSSIPEKTISRKRRNLQ